MAIVNERLFKDVQDLTVNGLNIGAVQSIEVAQSYMDVITDQDGAEGPRGLGKAGERVDVRISTRDIASLQTGNELLIALLGSTPGTAVFSGKEAGATTYGKTTIGVTAESVLVFHNLSLRANRTDYAALDVTATVRFDQAKALADVCLYEPTQAAPAGLNDPVRLWRPLTLTHSSTPVHIVDFTMNIVGRLLVDYGDSDTGLASVDVADWTIGGTVTHRDSNEEGTDGYDISTKMLTGAQANLVVTLQGTGGAGNKILTILQTEFTGRRRITGLGYTDHIMDYRAQFDVGGTEKTLAEMVTVADPV